MEVIKKFYKCSVYSLSTALMTALAFNVFIHITHGSVVSDDRPTAILIMQLIILAPINTLASYFTSFKVHQYFPKDHSIPFSILLLSIVIITLVSKPQLITFSFMVLATIWGTVYGAREIDA